MVETNIRIVGTGPNLTLFTRCAKNTTQDHSPKFLEKVCKKLQHQGLAAVYCPIRKKILVLTRGPIPPVTVKGENWIVEVKNANEGQRIDFSASENDAELLAQLIDDFWQYLGSDLLGHRKLQVARYFWHPQGEKVIHLKPEALQFADEYSLPTPQNRSEAEFREHYRQRLPRLRKVGCLDVPFLMERVVHFAIPNKATEEMRSRLIVDVTEHLSQLPFRSCSWLKVTTLTWFALRKRCTLLLISTFPAPMSPSGSHLN